MTQDEKIQLVAGTGIPGSYTLNFPRGAGGFATQRLPVGAFFRGGFSQSALVSGNKDRGGAGTASRVAGQMRWWQWRREHSQ